MPTEKILIFIPTYNEHENVEKLYAEIAGLSLNADILFMDDNSPDGTGAILEQLAKKNKEITVLHRSGKLGIGSAHVGGIRWAYEHNYKILVTMDCDFTHSPEDIKNLLKFSQDYDVVVGSRYMNKNSLDGWNIFRKTLTNLGHFLTRICLGMPYDATGAFRLYRLDKIPKELFSLIQSKGYSFFFESLYAIQQNKFKIKEIPIILPPRVYGHSKMSIKEAYHSFERLIRTYILTLTNKNNYKLPSRQSTALGADNTKESWDMYWKGKQHAHSKVYDSIAEFYRKFIIKKSLNYFINQHFKPGTKVLHAGCGSGQVDVDIVKNFSITAMDISAPALEIYQKTNSVGCKTVLGSILKTSFEAGTFDGIYNLGVMEHFSTQEIQTILLEFKRILKAQGKIVLFWPHENGSSVTFLKFVHFILNNIFKKNIKLHPDEISRLKSKQHAQNIIEQSGLVFVDYYFGPKDLFTQAVVVAQKD